MASTTFNGPVRSEKGFQVATKNATTGAITTRMSSGMPDLTGLSVSDVATATSITLAADTISVVNYTGAAAAACTLPAATQGTIVVYAQAKDTTGGTATLTFDAAGSDVWATGSVIGTPPSIKDNVPAQTLAIDVEPFDPKMSETTLIVYGNSSTVGTTDCIPLLANLP